MSADTKIKVYKIPKDFALVHGHGTQVVVVKKLKTAEEDRLLKKAIKKDYKNVFRDVLVIRNDEITKKNFINISRGRTISGVELRTFLPAESNEILVKTFGPSMSCTNDSYLKNNVYPNLKENTDK